MAGYDPNSCNSLQKPYYRPIEIALRWCGLIDHESQILEAVGEELMPGVSMFPKWPCLRVNCEKILDAIANEELPYGRDGKTVPFGEQVAKQRRTVRHNDLRAWMQRHYPGQKPEFLFDEVERDTHEAISADAFHAIQAKLKASDARIEKAKEAWLSQNEELKKAQEELRKLKAKDGGEAINPRRRTTYLVLIEGLALEAMNGDIPEQPYKAAGILQAILERYALRLDKDPIANTLKEIQSIRKDRESEIS